MTFEEEEKIRIQGFNDFWKFNNLLENKSIDDNPYPKNTDEYDWWSIGYLEAFNSTYEEFYLS